MLHAEIKKAEGPDVPAIKAVEVECGLSPWTEAAYTTELDRPDAIVLVATIGDSVVGFISGRSPLDRETDAALNNIGVIPKLRFRGLGHQLLTSFTDVCTTRGAAAIWLEVRASNSTAISFYRSHGFISKGTRRKFYRDPTEAAELMSLLVPRVGIGDKVNNMLEN